MKNLKNRRLGLTALLLLLFFFSTQAVYPIPKEIEEALKLNRVNHFDEALEVVEKALSEEKITPDITSAYTVGRILYRKGEFYREIAEVSILTSIGRILQIESDEKKLPDGLKLFLAKGYFFNRQYTDAVNILKQVVSSPGTSDEFLALARVYLGASYYRLGDKKKAERLWQDIDRKQAFAFSTLGLMYAFLNINPAQGELMTRQALEGISENRKSLSPELVESYGYVFQVYHAFSLLALGRFHEAYSEIKDVKLNLPVYVYTHFEGIQMRFYDVALLLCYSRIIFGESIKNLEPIVSASSGELASFASFYVAQMYLYLEDYETSLKFALKAKKLSVAGSLTMYRAIACESANYMLAGKQKKGSRIIRKEMESIFGKPSFLLEMMKALISSGISYENVKDVIEEVESYIYETQWEKTRRDSALMGELSFFAGNYGKALYYLERARDKGNKNRIETNDPGFLLKLSYVYYSREDYSESLEILFSLGKSFSGIRPVQDAVQSVYSYKQKGTGEAIIE